MRTSATCPAPQNVDLVDDDDDLLAPAADLLEKGPLGLGERTVGGGHEQHEIRPRHELRGDRLVLADDRVGARRIDDVDVAKDRGGRGDDVQVVVADLPSGRLAVLQHVDLRGRRRHPFLRYRAPTSALMNALLPALNSPTMTSRKSSSSWSIDCRAPPGARPPRRTSPARAADA